TGHEHNEGVMILAAKFADERMAEVLLTAGAPVDARDDEGRTALFFAPVGSPLFAVLLAAGADPSARDDAGNTILIQTVARSASLAEVEELLRLGIAPDARNNDGVSARDVAVSLGLTLVAERLRASA